MNNSKFKILMNALFAFIIGATVTTVVLSSYNRKKKRPYRPNFIYKGFESLSIQDLEFEYGEKGAQEIINNIGKLPTSFACDYRPEGADLSAKAAAKIGISILASKYGRYFINSQKPFQVYLLENRVWKVKGTPDNISHASSEIYIQKADAQILRITRKSN